MHLTGIESLGFPIPMHRSVRHILRIALVAVAICASSLSGYMGVLAAFDVHSHGPHGAHTHASVHQHDADVSVAQAAHAEDRSSSDESGSANHVCAHMHVQCCGSFAVPAADCGLKVTIQARATGPAPHVAIPLGQLTSPLFRPPRAVV